MKKVLIYLHKDRLAPTGGPEGYNYNLYLQLKEKTTNISFIETDKGRYSNINKTVNLLKNGKLKTIIQTAKRIVRKGMMLYGINHHAIVDINDYDLIHFHTTADMYDCRDDLKKYKGKVILTSHSPTLLSKEYFDILSGFEKKHMKWFYRNLIKMDEYAFNRADYLFFPCPEAEEPYYNNWDYFKTIKIEKGDRFRYILTGIAPCRPKLDKKSVRNKYGIPENAFVVCYVGRHNTIKGYDSLKLIGQEILKNNENIYFLIAGKESPIKGLEHSRWIEIGWTNDPHSVISASDMFLLPNKETYFDLVMLEVLSLGQIILTTFTGGNRYFEQLKPNGIFYFSNIIEACERIEEIKNLTLIQQEKLRKLNHGIYENNFTSSIFADNYIKLIESL